MRGKVYKNIVCSLYNRITPAYAGKSWPACLFHPFFQDHPRLCGEKRTKLVMQLALLGSPPPMRGKVSFSDRPITKIRITPAYAGKSSEIFECQLPQKDHPRLCGEKDRCLAIQLLSPGSPPPMRGKVIPACGVLIGMRITPAYAGKRHFMTLPVTRKQDHPRLCGEKELAGIKSRKRVGSPPPMRGKVAASTQAVR